MNTIQALIQQADGETDWWQAHLELTAAWEDIHQTDGRARQGMGLTETPLKLPEDDMALLSEYMATH